MMNDQPLTEQESLKLITEMIGKAKGSYHDTGIGSLLWGSVVSIASLVNYLQLEYNFQLSFNIWWIVIVAIIPQVFISIKQRKTSKIKHYNNDLVNAVWLVYGISIFALTFYQNIVPNVTLKFISDEGWVLLKHYTDGRPSEPITPFAPSFYSIYILLYAFPTMVTAMVTQFKPMKYGAFITYGLFIASLYTVSKYDMFFGAIAAIFCWFIPGIILRKKYLAQTKLNV
jgi:hypothetical protein